MADPSESLKKARAVWLEVRAFGTLWLGLVCLGGFLVLIGGPFIPGLAQRLFGPAAAKPGPVITLDMLFTLPLAIYFWIQGRRLAEGEVACAECGDHYPKTSSSCPTCGCANPHQTTNQPAATT